MVMAIHIVIWLIDTGGGERERESELLFIVQEHCIVF